MVILGCAPCFDEVTQYSFKWHERLYESVKGEKVELLKGEAVKDKYNQAVKTHNPHIITFYDHGDETSFIGNDLKALLDSGNVDTTSGREVFSMCCLTAKTLGVEAYRKGCKAWWGYTKPFSFITTSEETFCTLANMGLLLRLEEGCSWPTALGKVKEAFDKEVDNSDDPWVIVSLVNDRNALVCYTDETPPKSDCLFRNLGIRLFGTSGQKMSRKCGVTIVLFYIFYGMSAYGYLKENLQGLEVGCIGLAGMLASSLILLEEYLRQLRKC